MSFQIAIDGYSSCGKSTLAKALAERLNFLYIDSGAMYRAITYYFMTKGIAATQQERILQELSAIKISFDRGQVLLNGEDISQEIRSMQVAEKVSAYAAIPAIRTFLVKEQQALGASTNIVMDGRDVGTTVFPEAQVKIFMTADPMIRAERRYSELVAHRAEGPTISKEEVLNNLLDRDYQDTHRTVSPLQQAKDAIVLDNSNLTPQEQVDYVHRIVLQYLQ